MPFQSPLANADKRDIALALEAQAEDFVAAGIYTAYRGVRMLGYKNDVLLNKQRRGESLMTSIYALRLSRIIRWRDAGYDTEILYSVDWRNKDVVYRQGKSLQETDELGERIKVMHRNRVPLDPFKVLRGRRRADETNTTMAGADEEDGYKGQRVSTGFVLGALIAAKPGYHGLVPEYEAMRIVNEAYPGCLTRESLRQLRPPRGVWSGMRFDGVILGNLPEPAPKAPPEPKTAPKPPSEPEPAPEPRRVRGFGVSIGDLMGGEG